VDTRYGPLLLDVEPGLVVVTIDHPPTNLVDAAFVSGLVGLLDAVERDGSVRVVVFRSADPDFFLMHGDVESLLRIPRSRHTPPDAPNVAAATFQRLSSASFVSIGAVDGAARGGGCEFLTALDLRYGTARTVIGQPEVPMGILPGAGGTVRLPRLLGRARALEVILTGSDYTAHDALALGWLNALVSSHDLDAHVLGIARRIATMPPGSVAAVKRVVDRSLGDLHDALVAESDALGQLTSAGAHHDPMRRFLDAGGQTREGETTRMTAILDAMRRDG
jgi:enoyl-CoA hydratase/carnithine racemase